MEPSVKMIVVYSKAGCPFCSLLKNGLRKRGFEFKEVDVTDDATRQAFYARHDVNTVPQLFIANLEPYANDDHWERIGGWTEVNKDWQVLEVAR